MATKSDPALFHALQERPAEVRELPRPRMRGELVPLALQLVEPGLSVKRAHAGEHGVVGKLLRLRHVYEDVDVVRHDAPRQKPDAGEGRAALHDVYEPVTLACAQEERPVGDPAYQVIHPVMLVLARLPHAAYYTITSQTVSHRPYHKGLTRMPLT